MDISQIRMETPGVDHVKHFNNAGAALQPVPVLERIREYQEFEFLNGGYESAAHYKEEIQSTHNSVASLIHSKASDIALVENATYAWDMAFHSIPFKEGDVILTSLAEYASNFIAFLQVKKKYGVEIKVVPNDSSGQIDLDELEKSIDANTRLIAINHCPTNSGLVNPAEEVGSTAKRHGVLFLLDACQSIGQVPIDVNRVNCDFLSATGRKYLRGPRGTGFLYASEYARSQVEPVFLDLHSADWQSIEGYAVRKDSKRFENWECNYSLRLGLKAAAEYARQRESEGSWSRIQNLAAMLRSQLDEVPNVHVLDKGAVLGGIVTFTVDKLADTDVASGLLANKVNVSVAPGNAALLDMQEKGIKSLVRASVHYYNTEEEINYFVGKLQQIINGR